MNESYMNSRYRIQNEEMILTDRELINKIIVAQMVGNCTGNMKVNGFNFVTGICR